MDIYFCNRLDITPERRDYFVKLHNDHPDVVLRFFRKWCKAHSVTDDNYRYACDLVSDDKTVAETFFTDEAGFRTIEQRRETTALFKITKPVYLDLSPPCKTAQ